VNGVKVADILFSLLSVCLCVRTQSINRLCTGRWSPWRHRCTACCGKSILCDITVTFSTFLLKPDFDLEADYIIRKPIKRRFQQYLVPAEILSTFHTRVEYFSRRTIRHSTHSNEWGRTQSSLQQCVCVSLPQRISHLADICTLWASSSCAFCSYMYGWLLLVFLVWLYAI